MRSRLRRKVLRVKMIYRIFWLIIAIATGFMSCFPVAANETSKAGFQENRANIMKFAKTGAAFLSSTAVYNVIKIQAQPSKGFDWPFYLGIPSTLPKSTKLLVCPNNTGTSDDDPQVHDDSAYQQALFIEDLSISLNTPVLVPTFPRPSTNWQIYTHSLDRDTILTTLPGLERIDLQLIAMIEYAIDYLKNNYSVAISSDVLMNGFSASGMFTSRFTALHPERIAAAASGSPGGWPIVPVSSWNGTDLPYHIGVSDLNTLINKPFDEEAYKATPQFFYIGSDDYNDSVPYDDSYTASERTIVNNLFGMDPQERWPNAEQVHASAGGNFKFKTYPGIGHWVNSQMKSDIESFFLNNLGKTTKTILTNTSPDHTVTFGNDEQVYGTSSSNQIILESGAKAELINFPGQNDIQIQSSADVFTVSRSGTVVTFEGSDGTVLKIPATGTGQTIFFNGEGSRVLQIYDDQVMLDDQVIGFSVRCIGE